MNNLVHAKSRIVGVGRKQGVMDKLRRLDSTTSKVHKDTKVCTVKAVYKLGTDAAGNKLLLKYSEQYATKKTKEVFRAICNEEDGNRRREWCCHCWCGFSNRIDTPVPETEPRVVYDTDESFDVIKVAHEKTVQAKIATCYVRCACVAFVM